MSALPVTLDPQRATAIVRAAMGAGLTVTGVRRMHGGATSDVYEWTTDGEPATLVAKLAPSDGDQHLQQEYQALRWYRRHTRVAVPDGYACVTEPDILPHTCLLMRRLPGRTLSEARLSPRGKRVLQHQLAVQVAELHRHRRQTYGNALGGESYDRWLDRFAPAMQANFDNVRDRLTARTQWVIAELIRQLDRWLPETHRPTLIHGDLWASNIIVDDLDADRPTLSGFIDCGVNYSEVEYELAYLRVFNTCDHTFFETYSQSPGGGPLRSGFERRCRVYWLNTAMTHVTTFGPSYLEACEKLADQLHKLV